MRKHLGRWVAMAGLAAAACLLIAAARPVPAPEPSLVPGPTALPAEIRVGLATDLDRLEVSCCETPSWLVAEDGERHVVDGRFSVRPAPGRASPGDHRLQVAALRDRWQAERLAARLAELLTQDADSVLDAATGLYRVRVGRYGGREQAEEARGRLQVEGFDDIWIVVEGGVLEDPAFEVDGMGRIAGRRLPARVDRGRRGHSRPPLPRRARAVRQRPCRPQHRERGSARGLCARRRPGRVGTGALSGARSDEGAGGRGAYLCGPASRRVRRRGVRHLRYAPVPGLWRTGGRASAVGRGGGGNARRDSGRGRKADRGPLHGELRRPHRTGGQRLPLGWRETVRPAPCVSRAESFRLSAQPEESRSSTCWRRWAGRECAREGAPSA